MRDRQHIDHVLRRWPYQPDTVSVRLIQGEDRRDVIQMRVEMGVLQLETSGRPDGDRPGGEETYLDYLIGQTIHNGDQFVMSKEHCAQADREFVQFYHRRVCWLALREYRRAIEDADHTLGLMDLCRKYANDEQWALSHEQYRPFVLFHRAQACALAQLEEAGPEAAVQAINEGLDGLRDVYAEYDAEEALEDDELIDRLVELRESLREEFRVGRTLEEQLDDAVAAEQYELAAQLRDELKRRRSAH
jgi:hypothetical protein